MKHATSVIFLLGHRFKVRNFSHANNLTGWLTFCIALVTYFLTMEETASYWDPGEFIAVSYKLQVPHPPGAPLFLLLGRVFSFLSFGDTTKIGQAINLLSVLASAFTILFLYWSIVLFGRKLMVTEKESLTTEKQLLLFGASMVGALTYTFSDSFWFSAVEAEVYALSTLFTAFGVWAILKWELIEEERKANRWLLLIAYMIGLSIGVRLLNLLTLPAIALIYYFKTFKANKRGIVLTVAVSGGILMLINNVLIPGLPSVAGKFEIFFVNTLGLFFGSGAIVFFLIVVSSMAYGIYYTHKKNYSVWNTALLGISFILIGYGSYATIIIRAGYDTPINENAPKDVMSFVSYLKREQYGTWPLLYGPYFTARAIGYEYGSPKYIKGKDKYEIAEHEIIVKYKPGDETILPRAWNPDHKAAYMSIMGLEEGQRPSFAQNLYYMFRHQVGTMYMRYFMWNFAGRQSDEEGAGWLNPTEWFKDVPPFLADNKARNNFFMIPFLLGLAGMFFQLLRNTKNFFVITVLFFMLGAAIVIYLNSPPNEPRERDYIYAGSYYAFAIWIGLGIIGMANGLSQFFGRQRTPVILSVLLGAIAPALMAFQGWDDHDRSGRFFSVDAATNTLNSCDKDGIIFTGGDNDTFPLWYAQEAEGCGTDLRVLVLSYCNTDWYIHQTTLKAYESSPFAYTLPAGEYRQGGPNDVLYYVNANIERIDLEEYLALLARKFPGLRNGDQNVIPSRLLTLTVDKQAVLRAGIIPAGMENLVVDQMKLRLLGNRLEKRDLVFLDLLVTTGWKRPIYLNPTSMAQMNVDLKPYAVQVGNAYRILPVKNPRKDRDYLVDTGQTYDLMLNQFKYRGLDDPGVYHTYDYKIQVLQHRSNLNSLAEALIDEGKIEKAKKALAFSLDKIPDEAVPYDPSVPDTVHLLFKVDEKEKAIDVAMVAWNRAFETASWLVEEEGKLSFELRKSIFLLDSLQRSLYVNGEVARATEMESRYENLMGRLESAVERGRIN